jgi:hypothetical protein
MHLVQCCDPPINIMVDWLHGDYTCLLGTMCVNSRMSLHIFKYSDPHINIMVDWLHNDYACMLGVCVCEIK